MTHGSIEGVQVCHRIAATIATLSKLVNETYVLALRLSVLATILQLEFVSCTVC